MAVSQIQQVKLFTYSVVERKDEIEEVSAAATASAAAALKRQRQTAVDDIRSRAVPARTVVLVMSCRVCVCVYDAHVIVIMLYVVCASRMRRPLSSSSLSALRVFILFSSLEIRTVLSNAPDPYDWAQRSRVPRRSHQSHQQGQEPRGSYQFRVADRRALGFEKCR